MADNDFQTLSGLSDKLDSSGDSIFGESGVSIFEETPEQVGSPVVADPKDIKVQTAASVDTVPTEITSTASTTDNFLGDETSEEAANPVETVTSEETTDEGNTFSLLAEDLIQQGIFTDREDAEPITTAEQFQQRWLDEKQIQVKQGITDFILEKHGQEGMDVFQALFVSGAPIKDYLSKYDQIGSLQELDMEQESNQEFVYKQYLKKQGWDDAKIDKYLQRDKSYNDLEEKAKDYHDILISQQEQELKVLEQQAELRARQKQQSDYIYNTTIKNLIAEKAKNRNFDGIPLTDKIAKEAEGYLTEKRFRLGNDLLTSFDADLLELRKPENYELRLKMGLLLMSKGDLTKIKQSGVTETKDTLFNKVIRQTKSQTPKTATTTDNKYKPW